MASLTRGFHLGLRTRLLFLALGIVLICSLILGFYPVTDTDCEHVLYGEQAKNLVRKVKDNLDQQHEQAESRRTAEAYLHMGDHPDWGPHKLCIIVPFKDRFEELLEFLPHMHRYLNTQKVRHKILIINQVDKLRFNRASLINVGYIQSQVDCDYIAMHDVDLLPLNINLDYGYPASGPYHVAAPDLHPKYHYKTFVGGILLINNEHFQKVNGLSNKFWGWGREDDEFYVRMKQARLKISRPKNITTGMDTFQHIHEKSVRQRDYNRYGEQKKSTKTRDYITGLDTVRYTIIKEYEITVDEASAVIYNVELYCDIEETSWCVHPDQMNDMLVSMHKDHQEAEIHVQNAQDQMQAAEGNMQAARAKLSHNLHQDHQLDNPEDAVKGKDLEADSKHLVPRDTIQALRIAADKVDQNNVVLNKGSLYDS